MTIIAEVAFDIAGQEAKMPVRMFQPEKAGEVQWTCRFEIGAPINSALAIHGENSLQALALALKAVSSILYGSDWYRLGDLGLDGERGGYLGIPAPQVFLDQAPYPF